MQVPEQEAGQVLGLVAAAEVCLVADAAAAAGGLNPCSYGSVVGSVERVACLAGAEEESALPKPRRRPERPWANHNWLLWCKC